MTTEFDESVEVKDRTKYVWLGVAALIVLMLGALYWMGRPDQSRSQVRAKHILIPFSHNDPADRARALEQILDLRERIVAGESFERLAQEYSADPFSGARGGDLGYEQRGAFAEAFENYVWSAPIGELSEVITTSHGFHLVRVEDRHISPAEIYDLELDRRAREELGLSPTPEQQVHLPPEETPAEDAPVVEAPPAVPAPPTLPDLPPLPPVPTAPEEPVTPPAQEASPAPDAGEDADEAPLPEEEAVPPGA